MSTLILRPEPGAAESLSSGRPKRHTGRVQVAILVYDGITAAEALGPFEVFRRVPDVDIGFVARRPGPHSVHGRPGVLVADRSLEDRPEPDVLVVPGGFGSRRLVRDAGLVAWVAHAHATTQWTTAVSTGALLLGAAGVLAGHDATTHWLVLDELAAFGATPRAERLVARGRLVTASGGPAAVDLADLVVRRTFGEQVADAVRRSMTADAHRPLDARPSPLDAGRPTRLRPTAVAVAAGPYVLGGDDPVPRRRWSRRRPTVD